VKPPVSLKNEEERLYVGLPDHEPPLPVDRAPPPVPDRPGLVVAPGDAVLFHDPEADPEGTLDVPEDGAVPWETGEPVPDVVAPRPEEIPEAVPAGGLVAVVRLENTVELVSAVAPVEDASAEPDSDVEFGNRVVVALKAEVPDVVSAPVATVPSADEVPVPASDEASVPVLDDVMSEPVIVEFVPAPPGLVDEAEAVEFQPVGASPDERL
jgi:hypothetical protein